MNGPHSFYLSLLYIVPIVNTELLCLVLPDVFHHALFIRLANLPAPCYIHNKEKEELGQGRLKSVNGKRSAAVICI